MSMPYEDDCYDPTMMMMMMPNPNLVECVETDEMYMSDSQVRFPSALEKALDLKSERIRERVAGEPIPGTITFSLCTLAYHNIYNYSAIVLQRTKKTKNFSKLHYQQKRGAMMKTMIMIWITKIRSKLILNPAAKIKKRKINVNVRKGRRKRSIRKKRQNSNKKIKKTK